MAPNSRIVALAAGDAWSLLPHCGLGRLVYTVAALPAVRLLPFVLRGRTMVLALDAASCNQLSHMIGSVTAVEVDDPQHGWTVTITSKIEETVACDESISQDPDLLRWLDGAPANYVRIDPTLVSGRQVVPV